MNRAAVVRLCLSKALAAIEAIEIELGRLDAVAGDGDHGSGMVRGLRAANAAVADGTPGEMLTQAGAAFADAAGGASGALVGTLIMTIGQNLPADQIDAPALHRALDAGLNAVCLLGRAKVGDKTMVDTLAPFVHAFGVATSDGESLVVTWQKALPAAEEGMQSTAEMVSKRGRASRLGERSKGSLDPGAVSILYLLRAVGEGLVEGYPISD
jgi:dihydroxyacetone kinase